MILKAQIVSTEPRAVDAEEVIDPGDLEVVWDASWASDHPSNRTPTQRPAPMVVYERGREAAPTYVDDADYEDDDDDDEVPTIEIAPDVVLPLVKAMVIA